MNSQPLPAPPTRPTPQDGGLRRHEPLPWILGLAIAPHFVLRGWSSAAFVLLALFALVQLLRERGSVQAPAPRPLAWLAGLLVLPLLLTFLVQGLHAQWVPRYFDSPLRPALGAALLVYLARRRVDWLAVAEVAIPVSVLLCVVLLSWPGAERYYWGADRLASYFMDPLMLAQQAAMMGFLCLFFLGAGGPPRPALRLLQLAGFAAGLGIAIVSGSRTAWLMMPLMAALWLLGLRRLAGPRALLACLLVVVGGLALLYLGSDTVHERVDLAIGNFRAYWHGGARESSVGIRLSLFRIAWAAFLAKPWIGWGYAALPTPEQLPATASLWTATVHHYLQTAGTHNEWLQHMMYAGVFGIASRAALLLGPLALFAWAAWRGKGRQRLAAYLGLVVVLAYLSAGLSSEVLNLIYLSCTYGFLLAAFGAVAFARAPE